MCETIKLWGVLPLLYLRGKLLDLHLDFDLKPKGIQIYGFVPGNGIGMAYGSRTTGFRIAKGSISAVSMAS